MPGAKAPFAVFPGHAPMVSLLCKGDVTWVIDGEEQKLPIEGGFAEVKDNKVTICVE
jgi:F-type H+-transporting ATPase subunit epsilon